MRKRLMKLLAATALLLGSLSLFGQHPNLIPNSGFDDSSSFGYTEYDFVVGDGCLGGNNGAGKLSISSNATYCNTGFFNCTGHGGTGNLLVVNGDGGNRSVLNPTGNTPSDKKIVTYTIPIQPNIFYDFSFWATHLCDGNFYLGVARADFKVKFNEVSIGNNWTPQYVNNTANWAQFPTYRWLSGNNTQVIICIYDDCLWTSDYGDDFGLDDICFQMAAEYAVAANNFSVSCCNTQPYSINVLEHCSFNEPTGQPSLPVTVEIVDNAQNGDAVVNGNEVVITPNSGFVGADQIRVRVTKYGLSAEAVISITVNGAPSDMVLSGIPEDHLCVADFASFSPSATYNENGSPVFTSGWEWSNDLNGPWNELILNPFSLAINDYYLRFWAENGCGPAESDPILLRICDGPELSTLTISDPPVICEGAWLSMEYLSQVEVSGWNNDVGDARWEVKHGNDGWIPLTETTLLDGDLLRFRAVNCCNEVVTNEVTIHTTQGPEFTNEPYPNPFESYYCLGATLNMPSDHPQYDTHGMGAEGFWAYLEGNEYQPIDGNPILTEEWDGRSITYVLDSDCGGLIPYPEQFVVTVILPPIVQAVTAFPETVCAGSPIDMDSLVEWHHGSPDVQHCTWRYAPVEAPTTYFDFDPSEGIPNAGTYYVNFHAVVNECGFEADGEEPALITVIIVEDEWLEDIVDCNSHTLESGEVITQSQVIEYVSYQPCLHKIYQNIEIHHSDTVPEPRISCRDEFVWHGQHFNRSDMTQIAFWNTINIYGCDSVRVLLLDFDDYDSYTYNETACEPYVWEMKPDTVYIESTCDSLFIPAVSETDCDAWYYLNLTVNQSYATEFESIRCQPFPWYEHYCDHDDDYTHVFQSQHDCDSVVTMHFILAEEISYDLDTTSCEPIFWHGHHLNNDGDSCSHTFKTDQGCDSTVFLHFHLSNQVISTQIRSVCDSDTINGVVYDQPGLYDIYLDTLIGPNGCDSIIHIKLTIADSQHANLISGDSVVYAASNLLSGIYRYQIDTAGIVGNVSWSLTNPDWRILSTDKVSCRILVTTVGNATLKANFTADCGSTQREFKINAEFFDVDDYQSIAVKVFPNPTEGVFTVEAEALRSVRIMNMLGQTLRCDVCEGTDRLTLDLSCYGSSVYLLEVQTDRGKTMRRIVLCK